MYTAQDILKKCNDNYYQIATYSDRGFAKSSIVTSEKKTSKIESKFSTVCQRPFFKFEIDQTYMDNGSKEKWIILRNEKGFFESFDNSQMQTIFGNDLSVSLNGFDVASGCLPPIGKTLCSDVGGPYIEDLIDPHLVIEEKIGDENCYLIKSLKLSQTDIDETLIWISTKRFLILKSLHRVISNTVRAQALRLTENNKEDFELMVEILEKSRDEYNDLHFSKAVGSYYFEHETLYSEIDVNREITKEKFYENI